ncbi:MAG: YfiR family protein [Bacteroidota bacterium]
MKKVSLIVLGLLFMSCTTQAQSQDYRFHSIFMFNFTKYIQWPEDSKTGDFVIGIIGNSAITIELEKLANSKTVGTQKIVIKKIKSAGEAEKCQIVFIPQNESKDFEALQQSLKNKPVLIITEKDGLVKKGSAINFVLQEGKMRFEMNLSATQSAGLKVSSQLTSLAIL